MTTKPVMHKLVIAVSGLWWKQERWLVKYMKQICISGYIWKKKQQSGESWYTKFCDADTVQASSKYKVLLTETKREMNLIL